MRNKISRTILLFAFPVVLLAACGSARKKSMELLLDISHYQHPAGKWLVKIGPYTITQEAFTEEYLLPIKYAGYDRYGRDFLENNIERKKLFLEQIENQYLVLNAAQNEGMFLEDEFHRYIGLKTREAISEYYFATRINKNLQVSDEEIKIFSVINSKAIDGKNLSLTPREFRALIIEEKASKNISDYLKKLRMAAKIEINPDTDVFSR